MTNLKWYQLMPSEGNGQDRFLVSRYEILARLYTGPIAVGRGADGLPKLRGEVALVRVAHPAGDLINGGIRRSQHLPRAVHALLD